MGFFDKKRKKQVARQPLRLESEDTQTQAMLFLYLNFSQKIQAMLRYVPRKGTDIKTMIF